MGQTFSRREMHNLLLRNGWEKIRTTGSHSEYKNPSFSEVIAINLRPNPMVCKRIIKTYKLVNIK